MRNKTQAFIKNTSYDTIYQYYIVENHSSKECYKHFNTTERIFRAALSFYHIRKPRDKVYAISKKTKELRYGNPTYNNFNKIKETCRARFGSDSPLQSKEIWQKTYNTTVAKYGGTGFGAMCKEKRLEASKKANKTYWNLYHNDNEFREMALQHQIKTKKQNNSFNKSAVEEAFYDKLLTKYKKEDIIRQYKDARYPFDCDFYIKSLDLFIEINAHWTHGEHPFNKDDQVDKNKLAIWEEKAKTSKFYKNAIITWTVRDVMKYKALIKSNLNFILVYNKVEISNVSES